MANSIKLIDICLNFVFLNINMYRNMKTHYLIILFCLTITYSLKSQVSEINPDSIKVIVSGQNGTKRPLVKKLSSPIITPFKGLREIIPGKSIIDNQGEAIKTDPPYKQKVIGNPVVNNGLSSAKMPNKFLLNYVIETQDTAKKIRGVVNKIRVKPPIVARSGKPLYKEESTINIKYLDIAQGLFSSYIMSLTRDKNGMIWMGTFGAGLVGYDGRSFYQYSYDQGLPANKILSLLVDSKNRIWIGTFNNGLVCYDGVEFLHYTTKTGLPGGKVRAITEDNQGRIWVGTDNGLSAIYDNTLFVYGKEQGLDVRQIYDIAVGTNNELWIGTFNMGLIMFDGISFFQYSIFQGLATSAVWAVNTDANGDVWMGTFGEGIIKFDGKQFYQYANDQGIQTTEIFRVKKDNANNLWFGTDGGGLYKYNGKAFTEINTSHGLTNNIIWDIVDDPVGNYWFASYGGGLMKYDDGKFQFLSDKQGFTDNIALSFIEDHQNNMWIGGWGNGLMKFDGQQIYTWDKTRGLNENTIWDLEIDYENNIWFGTEGGGVSKISDGLLINYNTESGLLHGEVNSLMADEKGMWVGNYGGLNYISGDSIIQYSKNEGYSITDVKDIIKDKFGNIWIASNGLGITVLVGQKVFTINKSHGLSSNIVYNLKEDQNGNIWLATNNKINIIPSSIVKNIYKIVEHNDYKPLANTLYEQLKNNIKHLGKKHGVLSNVIRNFSIQDNGDIWVGTENGITKFSPNTNQSFNVQLINIYGVNYSIENYDYQQGFIGGDVFGNHSVGKDHNGNIWWGTGKMITKINAETNIADTLKPGIKLTSIDLFYEPINWLGTNANSPEKQIFDKVSFHKKPEINFSGLSPWNFLPISLKMSHEVNHITFNFTGLDWESPEMLKFQFMLEGYDNYWNPITDQHKSTYSNLDPGVYRFLVKAINKHGLKSNTVVYEFSILPPWWKTLWFKITAILLALVIMYIGYQWRIASYKHRQKELESIVKERTSEVTEKNEELVQQTEEILAQRNEIESQKNQLEKVHQDLMESIEYSHFIQNSMMPSSNKVDGLDDQFIFFRPKERISGDFYWWTINNNTLIATVADCTGHGVPGALMSMLGISFLREIVIKERVYEPSTILNKLRQEIIAVLDQKMERGVQKDGMDMALISIDINTYNAKFAGARNTLVLIRDNELTEYTSDKAPISIYLKMKEFSQQSIQLKKGDQLYLFSDGYPDQFNGENGKKFKRSRFKDLLLSISHKPMSEQRIDLEEHFETWKGNEDQIDDVTIVGFKL
jgi:ligand-binding sensor domain-containing protein/serine phosphatase RsbU (regulator of sigma subunit)